MAVTSPTEKSKYGLRYTSSRLLVYLLLLQLMQSAEGILHNTTRLEEVESFSKQELKICIQPLSQKPKALMAARLMVQSTANKNVFTAGNVTFWGISQNNWHTITIESTTADYKHILNATMDSEAIPFNNVSTKMWTSAYKFKEILLLTKGAIEIEDCPPQDLSIKTTTTEVTIPILIAKMTSTSVRPNTNLITKVTPSKSVRSISTLITEDTSPPSPRPTTTTDGLKGREPPLPKEGRTTEVPSINTRPTTISCDSKGTIPPPSTAPPDDGLWILSVSSSSIPFIVICVLVLAILILAGLHFRSCQRERTMPEDEGNESNELEDFRSCQNQQERTMPEDEGNESNEQEDFRSCQNQRERTMPEDEGNESNEQEDNSETQLLYLYT